MTWTKRLDIRSVRADLAGRTFRVTDIRELDVTLDGTEEIEEDDSLLDVVSRVADEYPVELWDLAHREIAGHAA